jgi:hypothetical protein
LLHCLLPSNMDITVNSLIRPVREYEMTVNKVLHLCPRKTSLEGQRRQVGWPPPQLEAENTNSQSPDQNQLEHTDPVPEVAHSDTVPEDEHTDPVPEVAHSDTVPGQAVVRDIRYNVQYNVGVGLEEGDADDKHADARCPATNLSVLCIGMDRICKLDGDADVKHDDDKEPPGCPAPVKTLG